MLVDDEEDITASVKMGLENRGFDVDAFTKAQEALFNFKWNYFDCIILDIRMPDMTGFQLARKIWDVNKDERICFFSAFEKYENEAFGTFMRKDFCFIRKPIGIEKLVGHINKHLSPKAAPIAR
jgi:DNA-binding response OmpR family regulator